MVWFALQNSCYICASIYKPKELTQILHIPWCWPFLNIVNLFCVCSYTVFTHDAALYRYLEDPYDALLQVDVNWASPRVYNKTSR